MDRRPATTLLCLSAAASMLAGFAVGQEHQTDPEATVVEGIVVTGSVPAPKVGEGAPYFTPAELEGFSEQGREQSLDMAAAATRCERGDLGYEEEPPALQRRLMIGYYRAERDWFIRFSQLSRKAAEATAHADDLRRKAAAGAASQAQVEAAELARQAAVNAILNLRPVSTADIDPNILRTPTVPEVRASPLPLIDLSVLQVQKVPRSSDTETISIHELKLQLDEALERERQGFDMSPAPEWSDLGLLSIRAVLQEDQKGSFLLVSGEIHNTRARAIRTPPLSVTVLDRAGRPLRSEIADARGRIPPGKTQPFAFKLQPAPERAADIRVTFGRAKTSLLSPVGLEC